MMSEPRALGEQVLPDAIKGPAASACTALSWAGNLVRSRRRAPPECSAGSDCRLVSVTPARFDPRSGWQSVGHRLHAGALITCGRLLGLRMQCYDICGES